MKKEATIFLTALMFLTRLPVPKNIDHHELYLQKSSKYFPAIGYIVGALSLMVFFLLHNFLSSDLAILGMMIASILTTGCFHEDGFADTCDAFGGGWTKEKILLIMKDSRLGTYGVAGLVLLLATKFLLIKEIIGWLSFSAKTNFHFYTVFFFIIIAAHSISRLMSVLVIQHYQYVANDEGSKSKPLASKKLDPIELMVAVSFAILPFVFLPVYFLLTIAILLLGTYLLAQYFKKWIDGYTGDCLGAIQQVTEVLFYLTILLLWKFI
jgi:adenosylcobinamide-GDP ribazoletransferase